MREHQISIAHQRRDLNWTTVTDHLWFCACGARGQAPNGFRYEHEALDDADQHERYPYCSCGHRADHAYRGRCTLRNCPCTEPHYST
jgi:hypothetical protein